MTMVEGFVDNHKVESRTRLLDGYNAAGYEVGTILDVVIAWVRGKKCRTAKVNLWTDGSVVADLNGDVVGVTDEVGKKYVISPGDLSSETHVRAFNVASSLNSLLKSYALDDQISIDGVPGSSEFNCGQLVVDAYNIVGARMAAVEVVRTEKSRAGETRAVV